jgi:O-acetyl-ADP-ribose deacetylase (regulator of RNase III)
MPGEVVGRLEFPGGRSFTAVIYDLLDEPSDAIVNAANGGLSHGAGVAAAIAEAAGPALEAEGERIVRARGMIPVGEAVVTTGGRLRFKGVVHAVGPRMGQGDEEGKLVKTLHSAFLRAHERGWVSISFPAIGSGIFAVPADVCARTYVRAVREFFAAYPESPLKTIRLALFAGPLVEAVRQQLA